MVYDAVVVGLGPAGVCACVQLKRSGFSVLGIEKEKIGGTLLDASYIENFPAFPGVVEAMDIVKNLEKSLAFHGVDVLFDEVQKVTKGREYFKLICRKCCVEARCVIIATGMVPMHLEGIDGNNVFYRIRDVGDVSNKKIGIIGLGDTAFDAGLRFSELASDVYILGRGKIKAVLPLVERATRRKNMHVFEEVKIEKIENINWQTKIVFIDAGGQHTLLCDKLLICIGKTHELGIISPTLMRKMKKEKFISQELCSGLYIAGDVANPDARYLSVALGSGMKAAILASKYLREEWKWKCLQKKAQNKMQ